MDIKKTEINVSNIKYIEELFTDIQLKDNVNEKLSSMKTILNKTFLANCKEICIGGDTEEFYGMSVYLSSNSLNALAQMLIKNTKPEEITRYIRTMKLEYSIEIDKKALYSKIYNFKPHHLTAMLLHELGHVLADTDFYNDMAFAYQNAIFNLENDKSKFGDIKLNKKDMIIAAMYIINGIQTNDLMHRGDFDKNLQREQIADKFVVDCGYGKQLEDSINIISKKLLTKYKKSNNKIKLESDAEMFYNLSKSFNLRRKYVTSLIDSEIKVNPVGIVRKMLKNFNNELKSILFTDGVSLLSREDKVLSESFISNFIKMPLKVSQSDIDDLKIEKEMMEDYDDKTILVYKIHKRISQLDKVLKNTDTNDTYTIKLIDAYKTQLNELLKETMKFKVTPKTYGVFIKYPKGYEG